MVSKQKAWIVLNGAVWLTLAAGVTCVVHAQKASVPAFEAVSIRPGDPTMDGRAGQIGYPHGRLRVTNTSLKMLIWWAYELQPHQVVGGPGWLDSSKWNIEATEGGDFTTAQVRQMTRSMLAERFSLLTHRESRQQQIYNLVVAKSGPKLAEDTRNYDQREWRLRPGTGFLAGRGVPVSALVNFFTRQFDRQVIDQTGLTSKYDFELRFTPETATSGEATPSSDANAPSIFTAVEEQLGLRLESARGAVDVLVVDSAKTPSEN